MIHITKHINMLLLVAIVAYLTSCYDTEDNRKLCDYSVRLIYHYNQENSTNTNEYPRYVKSAGEYIFDADGILYAMGSVVADPCTGEWVSDYNLPPGRYSVIAVGNRTAMSRTHAGGSEPTIGVTRHEDMTLTLENRSVDDSDNGTHFNSTGRLYHGYRTFTVEDAAISRIRVDMVHSHLDLMYTIRWKGNRAPANTGDFYICLSQLPSEYNLMPEYVYPTKNNCEVHDCEVHDEYNSTCLAVRHHIVSVKTDCNIIDHRQSASMFGTEISGQTISYRLRNVADDRTPTFISLWRSNATRSGAPEQLMKDIHLNDFLNRSKINLDQTLKQQYHIVFEIDPDTNEVRVWFANIADWDEGGNLGG